MCHTQRNDERTLLRTIFWVIFLKVF